MKRSSEDLCFHGRGAFSELAVYVIKWKIYVFRNNVSLSWALHYLWGFSFFQFSAIWQQRHGTACACTVHWQKKDNWIDLPRRNRVKSDTQCFFSGFFFQFELLSGLITFCNSMLWRRQNLHVHHHCKKSERSDIFEYVLRYFCDKIKET